MPCPFPFRRAILALFFPTPILESRLMDRLNAQFYCAAQLNRDDISAAQAAGVDLIVCNRPDAEDSDQPSAAQVEQWSREAGIPFAWLPVVSGQITPQTVGEFAKLTAGHQHILAYCRTGTRSAILWAAAEVAARRLTPQQAAEAVAASGRSVGPAMALLEALNA